MNPPSKWTRSIKFKSGFLARIHDPYVSLLKDSKKVHWRSGLRCESTAIDIYNTFKFGKFSSIYLL